MKSSDFVDLAAPVRLELTTLGLTGANENALNPFIHKGFMRFQNP